MKSIFDTGQIIKYKLYPIHTGHPATPFLRPLAGWTCTGRMLAHHHNEEGLPPKRVTHDVVGGNICNWDHLGNSRTSICTTKGFLDSRGPHPWACTSMTWGLGSRIKYRMCS